MDCTGKKSRDHSLMTVGILPQEVLTRISQVITSILELSELWNMREKYPDFYQTGIELVKELEQSHTIRKDLFRQINEFIVDYCNGFQENDLMEDDRTLYETLMNFTTTNIWAYAEDDSVICYSVV